MSLPIVLALIVFVITLHATVSRDKTKYCWLTVLLLAGSVLFLLWKMGELRGLA